MCSCGEIHKDQREQNVDFLMLLFRPLLLSLHFNKIYLLFLQAAMAAAASPVCLTGMGRDSMEISPLSPFLLVLIFKAALPEVRKNILASSNALSPSSLPCHSPWALSHLFFLLSSQTLLIPLKNLTSCKPSAHGRNI